ncbi:ParB/Srx family N-terminal domain-containing protein [Photobacterium atrarenae]|uniref:ParB/Srx family N-terminal domain-containing protein n=1 Tax=Photobacterium atrarenae TaxID=865757 RepID=A0ABY5GIC9_9GAMM|nr:ParB/Srx family N-terminal domain-containing protein [Photobacterium atrarenae]UTV29048.1 ParB/Srx family N-terminal domain-containing protein [Photobacterium atrarenae]
MPSLRDFLRLFLLCFATYLLQLPANAEDEEESPYAGLASGDVVTVALDQLLPTQAVLSYDWQYARLNRYQNDPKLVFDDLCRANGAKSVKDWSKKSKPTKPDSYTCIDKTGQHEDALSTVVVGPEDGLLYLTSGHHQLSTFWDMPNGGTSVPVMVKVTHNLIDSGDDFWAEMNQDHELWLYNFRGKKIAPDDLPEYLGKKQLKHDKYLSLVLFLNGISYKKPEDAIPFFEYHWAKEIRKHMKVSEYDLNIPDEYAAALTEAATVIVDLDEDAQVAKSKLSAKAMGQLNQVDSKALAALIDTEDSDFNQAQAYRQYLKEKSTPKRLLEKEKAAEKEKAEALTEAVEEPSPAQDDKL